MESGSGKSLAALIRDRYEPVEVVGRGGQGEVVRAIDHQHARPVAIKVRTYSTPAERDHLLAEARILLGLRPHAGLPLVREDFFEDDRYYLVMDWIEGMSLGQMLDDRGDPGLPASSVIGYLGEVADALDHLHAHAPPIVHRDVKPANIIVTPRGATVLVDFGISASSDATDSETAGSAGFAAPERAAGAPALPEDVYGLAATAVALLTGEPPGGGLPTWEGISPADAEQIERAVRRGLSFEPSHRPASAGEFMQTLRSALTPRLPAGTVTLMMNDVEGAGPLWEMHPDGMRRAASSYRRTLAEAVSSHGGVLVKTTAQDEGSVSAFRSAGDAAAAALALQSAMAQHPWPEGGRSRVRVALHTGAAEIQGADYYGPVVARCARLRDVARGGQILLSNATEQLVRDTPPSGASIVDLGVHGLKDLSRPENVFRLAYAGEPETAGAIRSLTAARHNLPAQLTTFVGRERETGEVRSLVLSARLVTLTGAGGVGKTRLALHAAADLIDEFPDGVWLAELESVNDAAFVTPTVARALGVREESGRPLEETLGGHVATMQLLIVLDNSEHLIDEVASVTDAILRAGPAVRILATSREPLGVEGEVTWRVPSLAAPEASEETSPERMARSEAVRLFVERAARARPGFTMTVENAAGIAQVCRRLDGIPLAIELAASRVKVLSPGEIADRLDDRFRLLVGGSRSALPRHQTLRGAVDWSHDMLSKDERVVLRRLGVFAGGLTIEAAEHVAAGDAIDERAVLDVVSSLVDRSLVVAEERSAGSRYRLLETVRQYARDRLLESGETESVRDRHLAWFRSFAVNARIAYGPHQTAWLDRLEADHDNIRAALDWGIASDPRSAIAIAASVWRLWHVRGYFTEGRRVLEESFAAGDGEPADRARALNGAGMLAQEQGDYAAARSAYERSLKSFRALGDREGLASALNNLGMLSALQGDYGAARALFEESVEVRQALGDRLAVAITLGNLGELSRREGDAARAESLFLESLEIRRAEKDAYGVEVMLANLGELACADGRLDRAASLFEESLVLAREIGDKEGIAGAVHGLGDVQRARGDHAAAKELYRDALAPRFELGDRSGVAESLEHLAAVLAAVGEAVQAARLLGAAEALRSSVGAPIPRSDRPDHDRVVAAVADALEPAALAEAWAAGRALSLDDAVAEAQSRRPG